jgi:hypothetical protein
LSNLGRAVGDGCSARGDNVSLGAVDSAGGVTDRNLGGGRLGRRDNASLGGGRLDGRSDASLSSSDRADGGVDGDNLSGDLANPGRAVGHSSSARSDSVSVGAVNGAGRVLNSAGGSLAGSRAACRKAGMPACWVSRSTTGRVRSTTGRVTRSTTAGLNGLGCSRGDDAGGIGLVLAIL